MQNWFEELKARVPTNSRSLTCSVRTLEPHTRRTVVIRPIVHLCLDVSDASRALRVSSCWGPRCDERMECLLQVLLGVVKIGRGVVKRASQIREDPGTAERVEMIPSTICSRIASACSKHWRAAAIVFQVQEYSPEVVQAFSGLRMPFAKNLLPDRQRPLEVRRAALASPPLRVWSSPRLVRLTAVSRLCSPCIAQIDLQCLFEVAPRLVRVAPGSRGHANWRGATDPGT